MRLPTRVTLARRPSVTLLAALLIPQPKPLPAADDADITAKVTPKVTSKARLRFSIGQAEPAEIIIGLYGKDAPDSVRLFEGLCGNGKLPPELSYRSSQCTRIEKGKSILCGRLASGSAAKIEREIDATGYVRSTLVNLAEEYTTSDENTLSHDRQGLISMKKGGGSFEFVITPRANPSLDATNVVIGEVLDGSDVVAALDAVPSRKPSKDSEVGGLIFALGAYDEERYLSVAKAGGDPRARIETAYRPLQKVKITEATLL